ncbi:MAG: alpha-glucan family phosphorylase, partial [Kiritimatiellia bacterium]
RISTPVADRDLSLLHVKEAFTVTTMVHLGTLQPQEVEVQVYHGPVDAQNRIVKSNVHPMELVADLGGGVYTYRQTLVCERSGRYGLTARVIPRGTEWHSIMPGFVTWADGAMT